MQNGFENKASKGQVGTLYRGVIEDNNHPDKNGKVKVRIFGIHTELNENAGSDFEWVQTDQLPWAEVMGGTGFGLIGGIGLSSILRQGTWVWVILEENDPNKPLIVGTISGINSESPVGKYAGGAGFYDPAEVYPYTKRSKEADIHRLARNDDVNSTYYDYTDHRGYTETTHKKINNARDIQTGITDGKSSADVSQTEPLSTNDASEYPEVAVIETPSGHVIELDDTVGNERVRVYHKSGSYIEIKPDGEMVQKTVGGNTDHVITENNIHTHIEKSVKTYIEQNMDEIIKGYVHRYIEGEMKEHVMGNITMDSDANVTWTIGGKLTINAAGKIDIDSGVEIDCDAPRINLN